jgi:hypothetical protein
MLWTISFSPHRVETVKQGIRCPVCSNTTKFHRVARSLYPPSAFVLFGGPVLALVFDRSRKPQFRCEKCGKLFAKHSFTSRFFQIFWIWFLFSFGVGLVLLFAGYVIW